MVKTTVLYGALDPENDNDHWYALWENHGDSMEDMVGVIRWFAAHPTELEKLRRSVEEYDFKELMLRMELSHTEDLLRWALGPGAKEAGDSYELYKLLHKLHGNYIKRLVAKSSGPPITITLSPIKGKKEN